MGGLFQYVQYRTYWTSKYSPCVVRELRLAQPFSSDLTLWPASFPSCYSNPGLGHGETTRKSRAGYSHRVAHPAALSRLCRRAPGALPPLPRPTSPFEASTIAQGAIIQPTSRLESGVRVDAGAVIGPRAEIGPGSIISASAEIVWPTRTTLRAFSRIHGTTRDRDKNVMRCEGHPASRKKRCVRRASIGSGNLTVEIRIVARGIVP